MLTLQWPHQTSLWLAALETRELLQLSGSRLPIQHSHTELKITLILEEYTYLQACYTTAHPMPPKCFWWQQSFFTTPPTTPTDVSKYAVCCSYFLYNLHLDTDAYRVLQNLCNILPTQAHNHNLSGANFDFHIRKHYTFHFSCVAKTLQNPVATAVAWPLYPVTTNLTPALYQVSSLYTMTMLIVRSWIVHLTPILGCSYHLLSSHCFLSTWGVVMLVTPQVETNKQKKKDWDQSWKS